jgi:periplasmic protein CpxP/Spy
MKRIVSRFNYSTTVAIAALFCCMTIVFASPLISQAKSKTHMAKTKVSETDRIEARIADFHSRLKITAAQEEQWNGVAQVMRENAATMDALQMARKEKGNTLNAVEDLKSYSEIADEHAAGISKFIPVFEDLYTNMSDDQKMNADKLFTKLGHKKAKKK